jgi:2-aminomuconate deaminase
MNANPIHVDGAPEPLGSYPHARRAGNFLFLSGIGPRQSGSGEIPGVQLDDKGNVLRYDIALQCRAVFQNVKVILESSGAHWEDLVDVTVFLTDMRRDFAIFNNLYVTYFGENQPTRTTVEVNALPSPIAIELKFIALVK